PGSSSKKDSWTKLPQRSTRLALAPHSRHWPAAHRPNTAEPAGRLNLQPRFSSMPLFAQVAEVPPGRSDPEHTHCAGAINGIAALRILSLPYSQEDKQEPLCFLNRV